jgi:serine/threonine protein kinase
LSIDARVRLLLDVLAALSHAHGNLVIHRDIKPSNILVTAAEFVTLMLSTVGNQPTTSEQLIDAGARLLNEHYTADPEFRVNAMVDLSERYNDLGLVQKQYSIPQNANQIAHQLNQPTLIAESECLLAGVEDQLGAMDKAVALADAGSARLAKLKAPEAQFVEDCLETQAVLTSDQGNPAAAIKVAEQALAMLLQQSDATHDIRYAHVLGRISDYYKSAGDSRHGYDYSERALAAAEQSGLGDTASSAHAIQRQAPTSARLSCCWLAPGGH